MLKRKEGLHSIKIHGEAWNGDDDDIFCDLGVEERLVASNHFPCDCRIRSFIGGSLFSNQSFNDVMDSNFCISPFEVHGMSLLSASQNSSLFDNCSELGDYAVSAAGPAAGIPARPSLPASQECNRPSTLVIYTTALFTLLKIRWTSTCDRIKAKQKKNLFYFKSQLCN